MKRYNVTRKHSYTTRDGEVKTTWKRLGSVVLFPADGDKKEGGILELDMFPESYKLFPDEPKDQTAEARTAYPTSRNADEPIRLEDIPF